MVDITETGLRAGQAREARSELVPLSQKCGEEDFPALVCGAHTQCLIEFVLTRPAPLTLLRSEGIVG